MLLGHPMASFGVRSVGGWPSAAVGASPAGSASGSCSGRRLRRASPSRNAGSTNNWTRSRLTSPPSIVTASGCRNSSPAGSPEHGRGHQHARGGQRRLRAGHGAPGPRRHRGGRAVHPRPPARRSALRRPSRTLARIASASTANSAGQRGDAPHPAGDRRGEHPARHRQRQRQQQQARPAASCRTAACSSRKTPMSATGAVAQGPVEVSPA